MLYIYHIDCRVNRLSQRFFHRHVSGNRWLSSFITQKGTKYKILKQCKLVTFKKLRRNSRNIYKY